jgi:hypothetical protein
MKYIYLILLTTLLLTIKPSYAQYQVVLNYGGTSTLNIDQLNDFSIINNTNTALQASIEVNLTENRSSETVLVEYCNTFLKPGISSLINALFTKEFNSSQFSSYLKYNGILANGLYSICIIIRSYNSNETPYKYCDQISIGNIKEIHLVSPADNENIETLNPILQWTSTLEPGTTYRLKVVPLYPYKTPEEALSKNSPYLDEKLTDFTYWYSSVLPILEFDHKYSWQVYALSTTDQLLGYSEAWIFSPISKTEIEKTNDDCYRLIHPDLNNGRYLFNGIIKFAYKNDFQEEKLTYNVINLSNGKLCDGFPDIKLKKGLNKVDIRIKDIQGLENSNVYQLIIRNKNNSSYKLTFIPK